MHKCLPYLLLILALAACNTPKKEYTPQQEEPPKALQEKSSVGGLLSKGRGSEDLVESLYKELMEKSPELAALEKNINLVTEMQHDSLDLFERFNGKNTLYYNAAKRHMQSLSDSSLKTEITNLIEQSMAGYNQRISGHDALIATINQQSSKLDDLHIMLKLVRTMAAMEKFQRSNLPDQKSLRNVSNSFSGTIKQADTLIHK